MLNEKYNLCYNSKNKEFHDDSKDKEFIEEIILPLSPTYKNITWTTDKFNKFDGYYNEKTPIQIKNRGLNYSIDLFPTTYIDYTAYKDILDENGAIFIIYPINNTVLYYNYHTIKNAYVEDVYKDMWSWSEKNKSWYWEKNKKLASLKIKDGLKFIYE